MRTNSPISDPEPVTQLPEPKPIVDPIEDEKVAFRQNKKYQNVLKIIEDAQERYRAETAGLRDTTLTYEQKGIRGEVNALVIQELENFKTDIELTYELRKQQS